MNPLTRYYEGDEGHNRPPSSDLVDIKVDARVFRHVAVYLLFNGGHGFALSNECPTPVR